MKRQSKKDSALSKVFERDTKPVVGEEVAPKNVRHIERPIQLPFLNDNIIDDSNARQYGSAEDMEEKWGLSEKQATLNVVRKRKIVGLAIAVVAFILLLVGVFYILPRVLPGVFKGTNIELFVEPIEISNTTILITG